MHVTVDRCAVSRAMQQDKRRWLRFLTFPQKTLTENRRPRTPLSVAIVESAARPQREPHANGGVRLTNLTGEREEVMRRTNAVGRKKNFFVS